MIISIDPGRKPGYVLLDEMQLIERRHLSYKPRLPLVTGAALSFGALLDVWGGRDLRALERVVFEGQYGKISDKKRRSILMLSVEAGWQACRVATYFGGPRVTVIHPQALTRTDAPGWRDALRCAQCTKSVVQRRVERSLLPAENAFFSCASAARRSDLLDATASGWGAWIAKLQDWSPPP